jgi:hypothetical protein
MKHPRGSRHRYAPHKLVRVPLQLHRAAAVLARREERSATATIARLLRVALADRGLWPAAEEKGGA